MECAFQTMHGMHNVAAPLLLLVLQGHRKHKWRISQSYASQFTHAFVLVHEPQRNDLLPQLQSAPSKACDSPEGTKHMFKTPSLCVCLDAQAYTDTALQWQLMDLLRQDCPQAAAHRLHLPAHMHLSWGGSGTLTLSIQQAAGHQSCYEQYAT